ncbi:hypothetical protein BH23PLA1_BH23PLA1_05410 [soil metagenome]
MALGDEGLQRAQEALSRANETYDPATTNLLAPIPEPRKVICLGLNYRDHAIETGARIPEEPVIFNKFPSAIVGPGAEVLLPEISQEVDFEAELVAVP